MLANDKDNEMIPGAVHRSPGIYLSAEENPGNPQLGDQLMKTLRSVIASIGGPLSPNYVGSIKQRVEKGEGTKEEKYDVKLYINTKIKQRYVIGLLTLLITDDQTYNVNVTAYSFIMIFVWVKIFALGSYSQIFLVLPFI